MLNEIKQSRAYRLNVLYASIQGLYWMIVCCTVSMGSAYLSNRGYSTIGIGALLALAFLFAMIIQQVVSIATDRATRFDVVDVLAVIGAVLTLDLMFGIGSDGKSFSTGFTFFVAAMLATVLQPFVNALNFHIEKHDIKLDYGVARAWGSFAFFIMSIVAGNLMKAVSEKAAPTLGFIVSLLFVVNVFLIHKDLKDTGYDVKNDYDPFTASSKITSLDISSIKSFIEKYRMFFIFLIGVVGYFYGHVLINNFIYNIVANVGGDEGDTGGLLAFAAILELPAMLLFVRLRERFGTKLLMNVAAVFFLIKMIVTAMANSVGMLYFSMIFQSVSFAIFITASVHFVDEIMNEKDAVKGQAFITIAMTVGNLCSSVLGGLLMRIVGVTAALWFGVLITILGVILSIWSIGKIRQNI